jgi:ABC-type transport system involved in multi-copper enzyme maturation permease subunit
MLALLRSELFRLNRRWMPRVLLLIVVAGVVLVYLLIWLSFATAEGGDVDEIGDDLTVAQAAGTGLDIVYFFATIVGVIMGASIVGTEYGWGTIRAILPRARSRLAFIAGKLAALALFDLVLVVVGYLAALAMSGIISAAEGLSNDSGGNVLGEALTAIGRSVYVLLPYTALAFVIAVLTRSNAAGIAIGLVVLFAETIVLSIVTELTDLFDWLDDLLISENVDAIVASNAGRTASNDLPNPWLAALILALWIAGFAAVAIAVFQRRDVTSGS